MALIDITPVMTSNTEPKPYVVSASTEYSGLSAFKVFRGLTEENSTGWRSTDGDKEKWIQLDFGEVVGVSAIKITPRTGVPDVVNSNAKIIRLSGFDGSNWIDIYENTDETALVKDEENLIEFDSMWQFSKFKIQVLKTFKGTTGFANISRINFLYDDKFLEPIMPVSYRNATLEHTLPMNTTEKILAKQGDARLGLLGLANDGENFGDLYVVGRDGRSHLTKSGIKSEVIFEGKANAVGDYTIEDITKYKQLVVCFSCDNNTTKEDTLRGSNVIFTNDIPFGDTMKQIRAYRIVIVESGNIDFGFKNKTSFTIDRVTPTSYNTSVQITKIIGIY